MHNAGAKSCLVIDVTLDEAGERGPRPRQQDAAERQSENQFGP